jgi:hypothetical protein
MVTVPPNLLSQAVGQHRCNVIWLQDHFRLRELLVQSGEIAELQLSIL